MARRIWLAALLGAGLWLVPGTPLHAQEGAAASPQEDGTAPAAPGAPAAPAVRVPLLLNLMSRPAETPERAMREAVREDAKPRAASPTVEVLPDGSVRIGRARVSVSVKEECPEDPNHELAPRPLPGRARR